MTLTREGLSVSVIPDLGGKITAIRRVASNRNALLEPSGMPPRLYRRAHCGASFEEYDTSGFDECFPTIAACQSPDDETKQLPDHGELWSAAWMCHAPGNALDMEARGRASFPYTFRRRLTITGETLRLDYELESESDQPMRVLWSAHPLLAVSEGSRIYLPPEVDSLFVNWSAGERLGRYGDRCAWPGTDDKCLDVLRSPEARTADKLFTCKLCEGFCAFHDRASDESIIFRFDAARTPYVGLWICQGGWPTAQGVEKHFTVALEPCSGRPDALSEAAGRGECLYLEPRAVERWWLEVTLRAGAPEEVM